MQICLVFAGRSHIMYDCLGLGLPVVSGKKWTYYRKLVSSAFHFDILKRYVPVYNEMSHKLLVRI